MLTSTRALLLSCSQLARGIQSVCTALARRHQQLQANLQRNIEQSLDQVPAMLARTLKPILIARQERENKAQEIEQGLVDSILRDVKGTQPL